jgi:hypothetical protein
MNKYFNIFLLSILTVLSGCIDMSLTEISPASTVTFSFYYTGPETYEKNITTINLIPTTSASGFSNFTTTGIFPNGVTLNPSTGAITGTPTQNLALTVFTINAIAPNGDSVSTQLNLTVNDRPVISSISNFSLDEDTSSGAINFNISDSDDTLTCSGSVTATSSNAAVILSGALVIGGVAPNCTISFTPVLNQSGISTITLVVNDTHSTSNSSFVVTVNAVDDAPVAALLIPPAFNEDTQSIITLSYSDVEGENASSCALSGLTNIIVSQACTCTLGSCSVGVTGTSNYNGVASFSYTVTTGLSVSNSAPVSLTISAVNDAPVMSSVSPITITRNTSTPSISVTVSDVESSLTCSSSISMTSSNTALVLESAVVWGGTAPNCTAVITPRLNQVGTSDISFSVTDGTLSSVQTFTLTVEPIAPTGLSYSGGNLTKDRDASISRTLTTGTNLTYSITSGTLPAGLTLNSSTGQIYGVPTTVESQTITVQAVNSKGSATSMPFTLNVIEVAPAGLSYTDIVIHSPFNQSPLLSSGSNGSSFTLLSGSLPLGLSLNTTTGFISGTILTGHHNQEFPLIIRVCNGSGCSDETVTLKTLFLNGLTALSADVIGSFTGYEPTYSKMVYVLKNGIQEVEISDPASLNIFNITNTLSAPSAQDFVKAYAQDLNNDGLKEIVLLSKDEKIHIFSVDTNGILEFSRTISTQLPVGDTAQLSGSLDFGDLIGDGSIDILLTSDSGSGTTGLEIFENPGDGSFDFNPVRFYSNITMLDGVTSSLWDSNYNGTVILDFNADGDSDIALTVKERGVIGIIYGPINQPGSDITVSVEIANPTGGETKMSYGFDLKAKSIDDQPGDEIVFLEKQKVIIIGSTNSTEIDLLTFCTNIAESSGLTITPSGFFVDYFESGTTPPIRTAKFSISPQLNLVASELFTRDIQRADFLTPHYFERLDIGGVSYSGLLDTGPGTLFIYRLE